MLLVGSMEMPSPARRPAKTGSGTRSSGTITPENGATSANVSAAALLTSRSAQHQSAAVGDVERPLVERHRTAAHLAHVQRPAGVITRASGLQLDDAGRQPFRGRAEH